MSVIVEPEVPPTDPAGSRDRGHVTFASHLEGDAVLACSGELDPATTPALRRSLRRVLRLAPDRIVIDLSRVSFFDAGAIGEFVRARNTSRAAGSDLVVRAPTSFGRRVLRIVGLTDLIAKDPGRDTAPWNASAAVGVHGAVLGSEGEEGRRADLEQATSGHQPGVGAAGRRQRVDASVAPARELAEPTVELAGRFAAANRSSVVIDEAKGLIAERFDIGIDEAALLLRAFSIAQHQPMHTAAAALMNRPIAGTRVAPNRPAQRAAVGGDTEQGARGRAPAKGS